MNLMGMDVKHKEYLGGRRHYNDIELWKDVTELEGSCVKRAFFFIAWRKEFGCKKLCIMKNILRF